MCHEREHAGLYRLYCSSVFIMHRIHRMKHDLKKKKKEKKGKTHCVNCIGRALGLKNHVYVYMYHDGFHCYS